MQIVIDVTVKAWTDSGNLCRDCDVHVEGQINDCENENYFETFCKAENLVKQALSCERSG